MVDVRRPDDDLPQGTDRARTRRERLRREIHDDIKRSARDLLVPHSTAELSLRAVARDVGIAPSGIYRYYASRQELVAAVAADAYTSAADALHASLSQTADLDHSSQALALAHAYRRWCLDHRAEFSLMFGTEAAGGEAAALLDPARLHEFFAAPVAHFARGVCEGAVDTERATALPGGSSLVPGLEALRASVGGVLDQHQVGVLVSGWAALHGFISLEVHGPLSWIFADLHAAFDQHARGTLRAMGHRGVDAVPTPPCARVSGREGAGAQPPGPVSDARPRPASEGWPAPPR